jgi:hypothetical protein
MYENDEKTSSFAVNTIKIHAEIAIKKCRASRHICKSVLATEITKMNEFFFNYQHKSSLHRFYALMFLVVKALRQWRQIREAMQR